MWRSTILISCLIFIGSNLFGQKPVALRTIAFFHGRQSETLSLFDPAVEAKEDLHQYVDHAFTLHLRQGILQQLRESKPGLVRLQLPSPLNITLDLYQSNIYSGSSHIRTSDGMDILPDTRNIFYRGMISGNPNSIAVVSVFRDKIQILYSDENGNKRIQQMQDGSYVAFEDKNIKIPRQAGCFVQDENEDNPELIPDSTSGRMMTGNCVEVYVECDFKSYQDNGNSIPNTEAWVEALWNEVITLYDNENIPVLVSDIFVYTSSDPFAGLTSTSAILSAFSTHIDTLTYNGRLAHFMSTRGLGGGIAYLDVLCSFVNPCAVSTSLSTTIVQFPTYSWNVEVVTHEMGHNMGSQHTHACAWNGNNTAIDGCGPAAGYSEGCNGPIPPEGGTIMSYCHLLSVGINFELGFGQQPGDRIRNKYNSASCNTGTCTPPSCTSLTEPLGGATNVDINSILYWASSQGSNGYFLTIGTTPGSGNILNNADVGLVTSYDPATFPFNSPIYVKIVPYNNLGSATGCVEQSFTTEPNIPPTCTHLTSPLNGANNVNLTSVLHWAHSVGNQTGYKLTVGTTPNGGQIANMLNVGNVNFWDPPGFLPYSATIYVKITPYGANGDVSGCITESFVTETPLNGDFCSMAINLPCGASISGNTTNAYSDPEAFTCVTNIEAPGIWYTFVGDGQNTVLSVCSQYSYDTQLNAYTGSCTSLTCLTGNDDYCNTGSMITFPTVNGTTYYILVQGWGGYTGTYTLTRTCYTGPFYCQSQGNNCTNEWIKTVTVGNFTKQSGATNYSDYTSNIITLSRGGSYSVQITPQFFQNARNEYYRIWIDLNKDGDFTDPDEQLFNVGPTQSAATGTITIPLGTATGNTRMRVSMKYNSTPPNCGAYPFGEVEDYGVSIRCNMVTSATDSGNGSLRNVSMCADDNENILFASVLNGSTINVTSGPLAVDGLWKWMADPGTNITIQATGITNLLSIPVTRSIEIQYLTLVGGTAATGSTIDNAGNLILRSCQVKPALGSSSVPIRNTGTMNVIGTTNVIH